MRNLKTGLGVLAVALLFVAAAVDRPAFAESEDPAGQAVFMAQKCNMCHSVPSVEIKAKTTSEKMKGPDVAGVKVEAELLGQFLRKKAQINGKDHKKEFKGTDEELKLLVDWVLAQ